MNYTTIEQSKRLLNLGLNPETADMCMWESEGKLYVYVCKPDDINCIPCWSLGALLDIIHSNNLVYDISNESNREFEILVYSANYIKQELKFYHNEHTIVDMVVWLLENGYIKTEK